MRWCEKCTSGMRAATDEVTIWNHVLNNTKVLFLYVSKWLHLIPWQHAKRPHKRWTPIFMSNILLVKGFKQLCKTCFFKETSKLNICHWNLWVYPFLKIYQRLKVLHGIMWQLHVPGGHNKKEILASSALLLNAFAHWKSLEEKMFLMFSINNLNLNLKELSSLLPAVISLFRNTFSTSMGLCIYVSGILTKAACEKFCTASSITTFRDLLPFLKHPLSQRMLQV